MKYHLTGFGVSALVHVSLLLASLPLLLWQDKLGKVEEPHPIPLSLAQFAPPPLPPVKSPTPQAVTELPKPEPKPVEKPKLKPEKKPIEKPKSKPETKAADKPKPRPQPAREREPSPIPSPPAASASVAPAVPHPVTPAPRPAAKSATTKPAPVADNNAAEAAYRQKLQNLIATRKQYPRMAIKEEVEGTVTVSFTMLPNGTITGARVSQSSGNAWLDKAAVQAVNATSGALPFPASINKARWDFALKVNFKLDW
ncbi:protein TonB [Thiothrix caldifontis]|uniref:Protein TonB n=1 Tax=Thiothrix caldifontis TaxID=525918 RepID=A0A1H4EE53_9GAMM|nr:energy transducer TonB [Thiothrix caldifontis]SEA83079.1 protein TonB [Thiothrix caldifontis]